MNSPLSQKPNIIVILADDLGWADVSFHGSDIPTPHVDRLAREGVELHRFYSCPVCSPTRAGLMTGRWPVRYGMQHWVVRPWYPTGVPVDEDFLPQMLARAGYERRAIFGKWHLGHSRRAFHPLRRGFTEFYGHYNGAIDYFTHVRERALDWHRGFDPCRDEGYSTELLGREAERFIRENAGRGPFFLYLPFNAVHTPLEATREYLERFASVEPERHRTYTAMTACMDDQVGRVLRALDETEIAGDTLVFFFSDNGGFRGAASNRPLRGFKGEVYEGGIRVVAVMRWPNGGLKGGRRVEAPMAHVDVFPTLKRAAGLDEAPRHPLDGLDMLDVLRGLAPAPKREIFSYVGRGEERLALSDGEWKLVRLGPPILQSADDAAKIELFRIDEDPLETRNFALEYPRIVADMLRRLKECRSLQPAHGGLPASDAIPEGWAAPKDWGIVNE
ncbi:MAG: arylsulfatase [Candidatus Sumerlaeota bacterium]|nr:arylsulfatase [Candidatus Sumerlaeota bacterium]